MVDGVIINNININKMTKADIVNEIAKKTGVDKASVLATVESFMDRHFMSFPFFSAWHALISY